MKYIRKILYIIVIICLSYMSLFAKGDIIGNIFSYQNKPFISILVEKSSKTLYVFKVLPTTPKQVIKFKVLIGEKKGDKLFRGDRKTPEGVYLIKGFIPSNKLSRIYGAGAFILNYPNIVDKAFHKSGSGIWIHGLDENSNKKFTKGCVALHNDYFNALKNFVTNKTPVVITNQAIYLSKTDYNNEKIRLKNFLRYFLNIWEHGNFNQFKDFIHTKKVNYKHYLSKKKSLFKRIKYRKIFFSDLKIFKENSSEILFDYNQFYCASNLSTYGEKRLYFYRDKLIAEEYKELNKYTYISKQVTKFIDNWIFAWESRNINRYKLFYSEKFTNLKYWLKDKSKKFKRYHKIYVKVSNLKFRELSPTKYIITFKQEFKGDSYKDIGIKKLLLTGCPGDFKILAETWSKL